MTKIEQGWMCNECPYRSTNKAHVQEHVQKHINGFLIQCNNCEKTFKSKMCIRSHIKKYHKETVRPSAIPCKVRSPDA